MNMQLYQRILSEYKKDCALCAHSQLSPMDSPCRACIDQHVNKHGESWNTISGRSFKPANPAYFKALCNIYEMYHERRAEAARELSKVETAIKQAARKENVDTQDVKRIFKRIK